MLREKGFATIIVVVIIALVLGGGYYLKSQGLIHNPFRSTPVTVDTSNWKTFTSTSRGIILKYPANWVTSDDEFISEKPFNPGEQDKTKTYNIIEIQKYTEKMYAGYTNLEWFNKIYTSTSLISDERENRTKIASGTTASGEQYMIFTDEPSATAQTEGFKAVKAYILKGQTIYQATLSLYDNNGLEVFKQVIPTVSIN